MNLRAVGHILVDGFREGVRALEDHADEFSQVHHIDVGGIDVLPPETHGAPDPAGGNQVVHPVEAPEERGFPASRGADERRDPVSEDVDIDVFQGRGLAVEEVETPSGYDWFRLFHVYHHVIFFW